MLLARFTIICAAGVARANGANDVSKGVATLVRSRVATYRQGLSWRTGWTVVGSVAALVFTTALLRTFSTGLVTGDVAESPLFPLCVATGAFTWVVFASRTGLPVSTTHALAGAIGGTGVAAAGLSGVRWTLVLNTVALPLAVSPLLAAGVTCVDDACGHRRDRGCGVGVRRSRCAMADRLRSCFGVDHHAARLGGRGGGGLVVGHADLSARLGHCAWAVNANRFDPVAPAARSPTTPLTRRTAPWPSESYEASVRPKRRRAEWHRHD